MKSILNKGSFEDITSHTESVKTEMNSSGYAIVIIKDDEIIHEWYWSTPL